VTLQQRSTLSSSVNLHYEKGKRANIAGKSAALSEVGEQEIK
jgi:hypothetical protein